MITCGALRLSQAVLHFKRGPVLLQIEKRLKILTEQKWVSVSLHADGRRWSTAVVMTRPDGDVVACGIE